MRLQVNEEVNTVIQDKAGRIVATCWRSPKKKKTIAKEFVRRWNAFEEGGIVEELRTALEKLCKEYVQNLGTPHEFISCITPENIPDYWRKALAALAKS